MQKMYYTPGTAKKMRNRFYGHQVLKGKGEAKTPVSPEREYTRVLNAYMKLIREELMTELPKMQSEYRKELENREDGIRTDSLDSLFSFINTFFENLKSNTGALMSKSDVVSSLKKVFNHAKKQGVNNWKKMVKTTFGVELSDDYYSGSFFDDELTQFVGENVDLIKTIPNDMLDKMKEIIIEGYKNGKSTSEMTREIQAEYGTAKRHARFIARDQIAKLNAAITQREHRDAGVTQYVWSDSGDSRVRESHRRLNGKTFDYANPPMTDNGRRCNPGEDYGCRCVGIPVFNVNFLNLPLKDDK